MLCGETEAGHFTCCAERQRPEKEKEKERQSDTWNREETGEGRASCEVAMATQAHRDDWAQEDRWVYKVDMFTAKHSCLCLQVWFIRLHVASS